MRFNVGEFLASTAKIAGATLQGRLEGQELARQRQEAERQRAIESYRLSAAADQEDEQRAEAEDRLLLGQLHLLDPASRARALQSIVDRTHARATRQRGLPLAPGLPGLLGPAPASPFIGSTPPTAPPPAPRRTTAVGVDEAPYFPVPPPPSSAPRPHFNVAGIPGDLNLNAVSDTDRKGVQQMWARLMGQVTNATFSTPLQTASYQRAISAWPSSIQTEDDLAQANEALRHLQIALAGSGPTPTVEKGRQGRFETGRKDKEGQAAERYYQSLLTRIPSWAALDGPSQVPLLREFAAAAHAAGHPVALPDEIRKRVPPGFAKRADLELKRYQLSRERFAYQKQQDATKAQIAAARRLATDARLRQRLNPTQNKTYSSLLQILTAGHNETRWVKGEKKTVWRYNYPDAERNRAIGGLYDLQQETGLKFPGIGLEEYAKGRQIQDLMGELVEGKHLTAPAAPKTTSTPKGAALSARDRAKVSRHIKAGTFNQLLDQVTDPTLKRLLQAEHRRQTARKKGK